MSIWSTVSKSFSPYKENASEGIFSRKKPQENIASADTQQNEKDSDTGFFRFRDKESDKGSIDFPNDLRKDKVVSIHATTKLRVILFTPIKFIEVNEIANQLLNKRAVVLNLEKAENDKERRRLLDFLSGVAYALDGKISPIANLTFFIAPCNVELQGDTVLDELENNGLYI